MKKKYINKRRNKDCTGCIPEICKLVNAEYCPVYTPAIVYSHSIIIQYDIIFQEENNAS